MQNFNNKNIYNINLFLGPLFIVGMPRSGTKLLRSLLNQHPHIGILNIETEFLPTWVKNWQRHGDLSKRRKFHRFYRKMLKLTYFMYMKERGDLIHEQTWFNLCKSYTVPGVFEALVRHDAEVEFDSIKIWGDKSPSYIRRLSILKEIFPSARFVHIIRDVRDYCLSINKAWGKNMIRAAQRWCGDVQEAKSIGRELDESYLEIRYEDLITEPKQILQKICNFLDIEFDSQMLYLSSPSENIGDAKRLKWIKSDNKEKYYHSMRPNIRRKIEAIASSVLVSCGYSVDYCGNSVNINRIQMLYYKLVDGVNLFKYNIKERGFFNAIKWNLNIYANKKW